VRLFVAINLPQAERERIHRATSVLRAATFPIHWVATESLHLTVEFLGEGDEAAAARIEGVLRRVAEGMVPFEMKVGGVGAFPGLGRPRVVWVGVEAAPSLLRLQRGIAEGLAALDFGVDDRPYHPHVTIGRAQAGTRTADFRGLADLASRIRVDAAAAVQSVDLMRSRLSPAGARYECLMAARLSATPDGLESQGRETHES
jgi:2'-5' RNA ligase